MKIEDLDKLIKKEYNVNLKNKKRNHEHIFVKKLFCKLCYDSSRKNTHQRIGDYLGLTHASVLNNYNTFHVLPEKYKIHHDEIIDTFNLKISKIYKSDSPIISEIIDLIRNLDDVKLTELKDFRIKPFIKLNSKS